MAGQSQCLSLLLIVPEYHMISTVPMDDLCSTIYQVKSPNLSHLAVTSISGTSGYHIEPTSDLATSYQYENKHLPRESIKSMQPMFKTVFFIYHSKAN